MDKPKIYSKMRLMAMVLLIIHIIFYFSFLLILMFPVFGEFVLSNVITNEYSGNITLVCLFGTYIISALITLFLGDMSSKSGIYIPFLIMNLLVFWVYYELTYNFGTFGFG